MARIGIGRVARETGVSTPTIRYYEEQGLLIQAVAGALWFGR